MSLDTVPKTNWTSTDGVENTDMNNIGNNLQALEDTKAERGGNEEFISVTATDVNATDVNVSGYTRGNYKSSDGSIGTASSFTIGGFDYVFKDGLLVSRTATP